MSFTSNSLTKSAFSMFDMMLDMQRIGLQAMSLYQPDTLLGSVRSKSTGYGSSQRRGSQTPGANEEQIIGVGEEVLNVGTRMVQGKTTKVRRVVVETPVQQEVTLHTETVVLERRRPIAARGDDVLTEVTVEMSDFNEVPVVSKAVHLVEEVLLRKEVTARTETIHETVKRDKLEIEQPSSQVPVVFDAAKKQDEKGRADEGKDKKALVPMQGESKAGDNKRQ